jgi:hypothetical protein
MTMKKTTELENDFDNRFITLYNDAMEHIKSKLKEAGNTTPEGHLMLVDIEKEDEDGCIPDEVYEMPSQIKARKYDFIPYHIWKITPSVAGLKFHGWDCDEGDHVFNEGDLSYETVIDIAAVLN